MNRRQFIFGLSGLGIGATSLVVSKYWPDAGFINPCRNGLSSELRDHELVKLAWAGVDPKKVWDSHAHLTGVGDSHGGVWINPDMDSLKHPMQYAQKRFFLNAGCASVSDANSIDEQFIVRVKKLLAEMPAGVKLVLLAFDYHYNEAGGIVEELSSFHTPNSYAIKVAEAFPEQFEWAASIHPYRKDCVQALTEAAKRGARAVKWLPAAMGMNPGSKLCDRFYEKMAQLDMPLITHAGMERAVHGGDTQHYGNPLLLKRAMDHGVRVIVAHCASMGKDRDIDKGENGPMVDSFELFARLMDNPRYQGKLFGDISAMTQMNRVGPALEKTLERTEWHKRLLNGSDYPLPGVMPLFSVAQLAALGYIKEESVPVINEIRKANPLLFDFVLKRNLQYKGKSFSTSVFETRDFFDKKK